MVPRAGATGTTLWALGTELGSSAGAASALPSQLPASQPFSLMVIYGIWCTHLRSPPMVGKSVGGKRTCRSSDLATPHHWELCLWSVASSRRENLEMT